jgi:copper chaperone CopZ
METMDFVVPDLDYAGAVDLSNALTPLNGVAHVAVDPASHTLTVDYDPAYSTPEMIQSTITGAGYRAESVQERT